MKDQIKAEIAKILQEFFQEEQANRVTSNNMNGLNGKFMAMVDGLKWPLADKEAKKSIVSG